MSPKQIDPTTNAPKYYAPLQHPRIKLTQRNRKRMHTSTPSTLFRRSHTLKTCLIPKHTYLYAPCNGAPCTHLTYIAHQKPTLSQSRHAQLQSRRIALGHMSVRTPRKAHVWKATQIALLHTAARMERSRNAARARRATERGDMSDEAKRCFTHLRTPRDFAWRDTCHVPIARICLAPDAHASWLTQQCSVHCCRMHGTHQRA